MFAVVPSTEIAYRHDFSLLCNARGVKQAVEVGTDMGVFAREFLSRWDGDELILVDDYQPYTEFPYGRQGDLLTAVLALQPFHGRYRFLISRSPDAAKLLDARPSFRPGFIYIDAAHHYEAVRADLLAWWARLGPDGIMAGHDFDDSHPDVIRAVREFAEERALLVRLTSEQLKSWYVYKTEPAELVHRFYRQSASVNPAHQPGADEKDTR